MNGRSLGLLAILGLGLAVAVSRFQPFPGYLDSDYYFAGGLQLASGQGFSEPYLWNYLDDPKGLPHASHSYWMPLASIIAAVGVVLTGQPSYGAGRLGFLAIAALVPVAAAALAFSLHKRSALAIATGLLAVFSIYYAPFLPVTDNYGPYLVLGALFFLVAGWRHVAAPAVAGMLAGVMTLARSDGVLWLALAFVIVLPRFRGSLDSEQTTDESTVSRASSLPAGARSWLPPLANVAAGFVIIISPWLIRNLSAYGAPVAPGGARLLWLTNYDETFSYPASQLTFDRWLAQDWTTILVSRLMALRWNMLNAFAAQAGIFLAPFIAIGAWVRRKDPRIRLGALGWLVLLFTMTVIFPFAGSRGGFFHAGAGFQSLWWCLAPVGLETSIAAARKRGWFTPQAFVVFRGALVGIAALMTAVIISIRVLPGWGEGEDAYPRIEEFLLRAGSTPTEVIMVRNPPGYFLMTGRPAIVVPYADSETILAVARRYAARYVVIEPAGAAGPIGQLYDARGADGLQMLGELEGTRVFLVSP